MWTLFVRLRAADKVEAETGRLQESDINNAISEDLNESITEVLHKAGRHMEDTIGMYAEVFVSMLHKWAFLHIFGLNSRFVTHSIIVTHFADLPLLFEKLPLFYNYFCPKFSNLQIVGL